MSHFIFNEAGSIAGTPGTFAHCRVDIASDGTQTVTPLATHPAFVPTPEVPPAVQDEVAVPIEDTTKTEGAYPCL